MTGMSIRGIVSWVQAQGPHEAQEDFLVHASHGAYRLLGVLDGHHGAGTAQYCARTIPQIFDFSAEDVGQELRRVVAALDDRTHRRESGSTLSLVHIDESRGAAVTAVLGDSPIIVVDEKGEVHRSEEHNVRTNEAERARAIAHGAFYSNGYICHGPHSADGLQLSRALGDRAFNTLLSREPDIHRYHLGKHSAVIIASDGLFDPAHEAPEAPVADEVVALVRKRKSAARILRWREMRELEDNTSLIVWRPRRWWEWFR